MNGYDEQLRQLQAQCARRKKLEAAAAELRAQRDIYAARARELEQNFLEEQADVDRLERRSLAALFYSMTGTLDEKRTKEQQEACAARVKYDAARRELEGAEADLSRCEDELNTLQDCQARYDAVLREKTQAVKAVGGPTAEHILELEARVSFLESQEQELEEAFAAGHAALDCADQVLSSLDSAEGWGTWDLVGGGLLTDLAKYSHLDDAQAAVEDLQSRLRRFKTELADVTIDADLQVGVDGFLRAADYIFDGIFADWAVLEHIHQSQDQVQNTRRQICCVLDHLQALREQAGSEKAGVCQEIRRLVGSVPM